MFAVRFYTVPVNCQSMIDNLETMFIRNFMLSFLDFIILKLFNPTAIETDDMIVMRSFIQFEHGFTGFEIIS